MRSGPPGLAALSLALLVAAAGCGQGKTPVPAVGSPGVLLVTLEGASADAPALARLASEGLTFEDAATVGPMARPSAAALMTGIAPDRLRVRDDVSDRLPADAKTLAERFSSAGWTTAAFVGSRACGVGSGLDRGFAIFDGPEEIVIGPAQFVPAPRRSGELADRFSTWLATVPAEGKIFVWVHMADGESDSALGTILGALAAKGRARSTEVVVAGVTGAGGDPFSLRRDSLRVPLVWRGERIAALGAPGSRTPAPVWLPDVAAGLAAAADSQLPAEADGRDPFATGTLAGRTRLAWTWAPDDQFGWPPEVLAIDAADPSAIEGRPARPRSAELDAAGRAKLAAAGVRLGRARPVAKPDPEAVEAVVREVQGLRLAIARGEASALATAERLDAAHPGNLSILQHRLWLHLQAGDTPAASAKAAEMLRLFPDHVESLHWAAHVRLAEGKRAEAAALLDASLTLSPASADVLYDLACVRALEGDRDGAIARLREAIAAGFRTWTWIEQDPDLAALRSDPRFAQILGSRGR